MGGGDDLTLIKQIALEYHLERAVIFSGYSSYVAEYMSIMDVFVLCSLNEGFPNVLLQAMSMNLPVVSADVGGCSEIINHLENGLLYPSNNLEKFISTIETLIKDRAFAITLGSNARRAIEENLSLEKMIKEYTTFYDKLSGRKNDPAA